MTDQLPEQEGPQPGEQQAETPVEQGQLTVRVGYTVGVLDNGEFSFTIHGDKPGIVELYGLTEFARKVIDAQMKEHLGQDEAAVLKKLDMVLSTLQKEKPVE